MIVVTGFYALRGKDAFGVALFDMGAAVVAAWAAHTFHRGLASGLGLSPALVYVILFVLLGVALFFASAKLFNFMQLAFSPFNTLISFVCGIVAAWAFAFALLEVISGAVGPNSPTAELVMNSSLATEILQFRTITGTKDRLDRTHFMRVDVEEETRPTPAPKKP